MSKEAPSWSFSSLPDDIILNVLARVPRRYQPILSCVSKKLRSLVRSSELQITRSLRGKEDRFYVGFREAYSSYETWDSYHWFTFTESHHRLASIPFASSPNWLWISQQDELIQCPWSFTW
uniref:F-box domain-containing protein n=1 Tax=Brassica oleracea var. oleracea TaxID=109376 RepID=A0A0D3CV13_BRAOL